MYEALDIAKTRPHDAVGVVGMGGLGHLAVMYARAMGCSVTVISSSDRKKEDAIALGATDFISLSKDDDTAPTSAGSINILLLCGGGLPDFDRSAIQSDSHGYTDPSQADPIARPPRDDRSTGYSD